MFRSSIAALRRAPRIALASIVTLGVAVPTLTAAESARALEPSPFTAFDNIPDPIPASTTSFGFQARSAKELGDQVRLAPGQRVLDELTVLMVSWACESGHHASGCTTTPDATFEHPVTLNIRSVTGPDSAPVLGPIIHTQTDTFDIAFRPSADPTGCPTNPTKWLPSGAPPDTGCANGFAFPITFEPDTTVVLPNRFVWSIAYNTSTRGYTPIGSTCVPDTNCGYDSLNVSLTGSPANVGQIGDTDDLFIATNYAADICGVGAANGTFQRTYDNPSTGNCWTGLQPLARIVTTDAGVADIPTTVRPNNSNGWNLVVEKPATGVVAPDIAAPPAPSPLGVAAAHLKVATPPAAATGEGKAWATAQFDGTRLDALTELSYSIFTDTLAPGASPSLQFDIKFRPTDTQWMGRLVFEPYYTHGSTPVNTWTEFDALDGKWWATQTGATQSNGKCTQGTPCTWNQVLASFPDATMSYAPAPGAGALYIKLGSGVGAVDAWMDAVTVGVSQPDGSVDETTFDFEPACTAVCYVSTTGDDTNTGSSAAEPLRNIQTAVDLVDAGGTIHVAAGNYDLVGQTGKKSAVRITKSLSLLGPNTGISPNDATDPELPNASRVAEATLNSTDNKLILGIESADVVVDGFRFTDDAFSAGTADAQVPSIGGGTNYGGQFPNNATIVNNIFDQPSRVAVFFNGANFLSGLTVDDNRVVEPASLTGCTNACGRGLFNLWKFDDVSFSRNVVIGTQNGTTPYWVVNIRPGLTETTAAVAIVDNTIRNGCDDKCVIISAGVDGLEFSGNDIVGVEGNRIVEFYQPSSGTNYQWTGGEVAIHHNVLDIDIADGPAIAIDNPNADLGEIRIYRNSMPGGGILNTTTEAVHANCNYWGSSNGPAISQTSGPGSTDPFLTSVDLDAACATPTNVVATAGSGDASVTWDAPELEGGASITGYEVTSAPDAQTCATGGATTCVVSGLTNGTTYTFTVTANQASTVSAPSAPSNPVTPIGAPSAPTNVTATPKVGAAKVAWAPPMSDGGSAITGYTVTAAPGGATCSTSGALTCTINGLTAGTGYTLSVSATNAIGTGPAASATATPTANAVVAPTAPPLGTPDYNPVGPLRLFDTRGESSSVLIDVPVAQIGGIDELIVNVLSVGGGIPTSNVGAVSLNVTVTNTSGPGYISVYPCGSRDEISNVNYTRAGQTVAGAVITGLSDAGDVCFYSLVDADIVVDINGTFIDDTRAFTPLDTVRVFDTRGESPDALFDAPVAPVVGGTALEIDLAGLGNGTLPASGMKGVSLAVTATNTTGAGFVTVYDCGTVPDVSNVNFVVAGTTVANSVITPVSSDGKVCFFASATTDLVVDANGWLPLDSTFESVTPVRVFDTRPGRSPGALRSVPAGPIGGAKEIKVHVTGLGTSVPDTGVGAVSLNVTATDTTAPGFVTVYACDQLQAVSSVNFTGARQTVANAVIAPVSANGEVCLYALADTHLVVDLNGWTSDVPYQT